MSVRVATPEPEGQAGATRLLRGLPGRRAPAARGLRRIQSLRIWMYCKYRIGAVLIALLLLPSLPIGPVRAEPQASSVPALPPVTDADGRLGIVQAIQAPELALQAGARWDRVVFPWSLIQKDGPNSWQELYYSDADLRAQRARGVMLVGVMIYTPQWASVDPPHGRPIDRPQGLDLPYNDPKNYWGQFVRKLADREKGVVDHWVVWNEPDMFDRTVRFTLDGSYADYFQLLKVAYLNIKEVNPQAKVIVGGFNYWWDKENDRPLYLDALYDVISRDPDHERNHDYFDIVGVHAYAAPLNAYTEPLIMRGILERRRAEKPIWITESNIAPVDDPGNWLPPGGLRATLDEQASYVIQSMAMGLAAGVERYAIYKMVDETPENNTELWGLIRNDRSLRPAYVAYQVGATYFANARSAVYSWSGAPEVPTPDQVNAILTSNKDRPQFIWPAQVSQVTMERGDNKRTTVVWNNSPNDVTHSVTANAQRATLVTKDGKSDTIAARDGVYTLKLPGSTHNEDKRDYSIYMIGGEPYIIDERVVPLPTDRVTSRVEMAWPQGGTPDAARANISAQLLMPGSARESVPCRYNPTSVRLWGKRNGGKAEYVADGVRRFAEADGLRYPVWDFNDVDVSFARAPAPAPTAGPTAGPGGGSGTATPTATPGAVNNNFIEFYVTVDGIQTDAASWTYGGPNATDWTQPRVLPSKGCE